VANLDLRPLSLGELLDRCFTLYRRYFLLFVGIVAIPYLLVLALQLVQTLLLFSNTFSPDSAPAADQPPFSLPSPAGIASFILFYVAYLVASVVAYLLSQGATVFAVSELYLGHPMTIRDSFRRVRGKMLRLLGVAILNLLILSATFGVAMIPLFLIIGAGAALGAARAPILIGVLALVCFIGVIFLATYVACRLMVAVPVALIEDAGPVTALQRSFSLTKKNAGRAFLVLLISATITLAAIGILMVPPYAGMVYSMATRNFGAIRTWTALFQIASYLGQALAGPIVIIATAIFYFDLRVRKEALDIQMMMMTPGEIPAPLSGGPPTLLS
jgi:hypothetical protein